MSFSSRELAIYAGLVQLTQSPHWKSFEDFLDLQMEKEYKEFLDSENGEMACLQIRARSWRGVKLSIDQFIKEVEEERRGNRRT